MQILFGPKHDHMHIDPMQSGAYEWWYFDALSDDGMYALVAIFFIGTPMSPYYKAVVDGEDPIPADWCGVFFSLHKRDSDGRWREIVYAYNLYRDWNFKDAIHVQIGDSRLDGRFYHTGRRYGCVWKLTLQEKNLWLGETQATLEFTTVGKFLEQEPMGNDDGHTWVCAAPHCRVEGVITSRVDNKVTFSGEGYHDHNFGQLPWNNIDVWYWGRSNVKGLAGNHLCLYYVTQYSDRAVPDGFVMLHSNDGTKIYTENALTVETTPGHFNKTNAYGLNFPMGLSILLPQEQKATLSFHRSWHQDELLSGPFYRRSVSELTLTMPVQAEHKMAERSSTGFGICEIFRPGRLCHPLWSRLMWTRIRRQTRDSAGKWRSAPEPMKTIIKKRIGEPPHPLFTEAERGAVDTLIRKPQPSRRRPPAPPANGEDR